MTECPLFLDFPVSWQSSPMKESLSLYTGSANFSSGLFLPDGNSVRSCAGRYYDPTDTTFSRSARTQMTGRALF